MQPQLEANVIQDTDAGAGADAGWQSWCDEASARGHNFRGRGQADAGWTAGGLQEAVQWSRSGWWKDGGLVRSLHVSRDLDVACVLCGMSKCILDVHRRHELGKLVYVPWDYLTQEKITEFAQVQWVVFIAS